MRRNAACVAVCSLIVILSGCKSAKKNGDAALDTYDPYAYGAAVEPPRYEPRPVPAYDPTPAYTEPAPSNPGFLAASAGTFDASGGTRYHTVGKGDTLYSLARQYYGDQSKWKDIYQANRTTLSDPNKIRVGQRLLIP